MTLKVSTRVVVKANKDYLRLENQRGTVVRISQADDIWPFAVLLDKDKNNKESLPYWFGEHELEEVE